LLLVVLPGYTKQGVRKRFFRLVSGSPNSFRGTPPRNRYSPKVLGQIDTPAH